jgi:biotin carboxyl carrier protein
VSDQRPLEASVAEVDEPRPRPERSAAERASDHAAIAASIDELLPTLITKLGATGLAELELREDGLRVRLRRPPEGAATHDRRTGDRPSRERSRAQAPGGPAGHAPGLAAVGPGRDGHDGREAGAGHREDRAGEPRHADGRTGDEGRVVATSPAVGVYQPRPEARAGTRVHAGDRLGTVDMLGIPQEVVAPADGLVGASLVDPGDAVEYGQELVVIEFASAAVATATRDD